jgi:hypothetical protein
VQPYDSFNIPSSCEIGNVIPKKQFYDNYEFSTADKKLFSANINKIFWVFSLKPGTINIPSYKDELRDYPEIEFIEVSLAHDTKLRRIAEIIMRAIPYPMVLIFRLAQKVQIWTAHQRINLTDSSKNALEELVSTTWLGPNAQLFERLDIRKMRFTNYFALYSDFIDTISIYNAEQAIGTATNLTGEEARLLLSQIDELEQELVTLRAALKKQSQFNRKMDLNMRIKRVEATKNRLLQGGAK